MSLAAVARVEKSLFPSFAMSMMDISDGKDMGTAGSRHHLRLFPSLEAWEAPPCTVSETELAAFLSGATKWLVWDRYRLVGGLRLT